MNDKICNNLLTTYNSNILDNISPDIRKLFHTYSNKNYNKNKGNTTLMKLIHNHYKINKTKFYKYIGGPLSLSLHWSPKYKMTIYIFGETHSNVTDCPSNEKNVIDFLNNNCPQTKIRNPDTKRCVFTQTLLGKDIIKKNKHLVPKNSTLVEDVLQDLFLNTTAFIDFYLEIPGYQGKDYKDIEYSLRGNTRISKLFGKFHECIRAIERSKKDKCSLIRAHYTDIRQNLDEMKDGNDLSYVEVTLYDNPDQIVKILKNDKRVINTLKMLGTQDIDKYIAFLKSQILQSSIVKKEFERTTLDKKIYYDFLKKK